jgi:uracil-DNA glycosylase
MNSLDHILTALTAFTAPNVHNPWRDADVMDLPYGGPATRQRHLRQHFSCKPRLLLVGEAPGYQGCHFSGIPFTSEALIGEGAIPRIGATGRLSTRARPWREPSATIVWRTLGELSMAEDTILWNAFAWHPHRPGNPHSNRTPTRQELEAGAPVLRMICQHFREARIVAVGRVADAALRTCGIQAEAAVRHPSMGGAHLFAAGLTALMSPSGN